MRRTLALVAVALSSIIAAVIAALVRPAPRPQAPPQSVRAGALQMTTQLDRRYLPESGGGETYLQVDLIADADPAARRRVPVNAVLILDRSGSMTGAKIDRARDAARAIEFSSDASVMVRSTPMTEATRAQALAAIDQLQAAGGTNMSAAFDLAAIELRQGRADGRIDKVFLASDGQANEGVSDRAGLLSLAQSDFGRATLSTFGMGDDYDEDLMTAFASQSGGRSRYIASPEVLPGAFRDELSRASSAVARNVRLRIDGSSGASIDRVLGYQTLEGGWVRLPDFSAGEVGSCRWRRWSCSSTTSPRARPLPRGSRRRRPSHQTRACSRSRRPAPPSRARRRRWRTSRSRLRTFKKRDGARKQWPASRRSAAWRCRPGAMLPRR